MSQITSTIEWKREPSAPFTDNRYSRKHTWKFDGGIEVAASSSPSVVPVPLSCEEAVDPEEAFVASISSCHMLWFLALAARGGFAINRYVDGAVGKMDRNEDGKMVISNVTLNPQIDWEGEGPSRNEIEKLHEQAHDECFIANSIKTKVQIANLS